MTVHHPEKKGHHLLAGLNTLRFQVVFIMLLCYFIPTLLLGVFMHTVLLRGLRERTNAALTSEAEHAWTLTTQNIDHAVSLGRDAIYDGELADSFSRWRAGGISDAEYLRLSRGYLDRKYSREEVFSFAAYFPVSQPSLFMYTRSGNAEAVAFQQRGLPLALAEGESLDTRSRFAAYDGQLFLIRNLLNQRMERYGMLILGINREALLAPLSSVAEAWPASLSVQLDGFGEPDAFWSGIPQGLSDVSDSPNIRYARFSDSDDYTFRLQLTVDRRQQYREVYLFRWLTLGMFLLLIPVLLLIAFYVRRRIVRPVSLLSDASRRIEAGELGVTVPMHGGDELGDLGVAFSNMSLRIQDLIDKTYKEELALKNAQIQALQSRINPHFINNALEDINWQARMDGSATVSAMVSSLSVLLNATMGRRDRRMVTLREEMEVAEAYIYFVQQRFGTDLILERDLEEKALDSVVPLLTVQPVLENAVEHGIAPAGGGAISLRIQRAGSCLQITIRNTGKLLQPEDMEKIEAALRQEDVAGYHLGLANIASRLRLIYGGRAVIRIFSDEQHRTVVQMDIPQDAE
ncbi:MAG: histidine kinase [Clostridia bacterium]|nr:histidine kinase [Clostridia bacterium]